MQFTLLRVGPFVILIKKLEWPSDATPQLQLQLQLALSAPTTQTGRHEEVGVDLGHVQQAPRR